MGKTIYLSGCVNSELLKHAGRDDLGVLLQPEKKSYLKHVGPFGSWGIDNACFAKGESFDAAAWYRWLIELSSLPLSSRPLFVAAPDVVGDPVATWRRSFPWLGRIRRLGFPAALVAQDGIEKMQIDWAGFDVLFIGGTDEWKNADKGTVNARLTPTVVELIRLAKSHGKTVHVGRVNGASKYASCCDAGADSADGTFLRHAGPPAEGVARLLGWFN
jgi:hypothetical protein